MASSNSLVKTGTIVGTGAAITVSGDKVGFRPTYVRLINVTDGSSAEHVEGMADASMAKQKGATTSFVTSGGITLTSTGFTLGTDTDLNAASDVIHYVAIG
jgi:hypothetical protein